jgi:hypothetical protein
MVILDRIRLRGLLRENPAICRVFLFWGRDRVHHRCITTFGSEHCGIARQEECRRAKRLVQPNPGAVSSDVPLAQKGVCLMSVLTQPSHGRTRGRPCGARRTEWVVRTRRDALLQLVPLRTRRGRSFRSSSFSTASSPVAEALAPRAKEQPARRYLTDSQGGRRRIGDTPNQLSRRY